MSSGEALSSCILPPTADSHRRAILAGLELSALLHRLAAQGERPVDLCANRCGGLDIEAREAFSRRHTCPCSREVS